METQKLRDAVIEVKEASEEDLEMFGRAIDLYDNYEQAQLYCYKELNKRFNNFVDSWDYFRRNKIKEGLYAVFRNKLIRE